MSKNAVKRNVELTKIGAYAAGMVPARGPRGEADQLIQSSAQVEQVRCPQGRSVALAVPPQSGQASKFAATEASRCTVGTSAGAFIWDAKMARRRRRGHFEGRYSLERTFESLAYLPKSDKQRRGTKKQSVETCALRPAV